MAKLTTSDGRECVICAATGSIVLKSEAVKVGNDWYRRDVAPGPVTPPQDKVESKTEAVTKPTATSSVVDPKETSSKK